jgi:hypothetical protein
MTKKYKSCKCDKKGSDNEYEVEKLKKEKKELKNEIGELKEKVEEHNIKTYH